MPGLVFVCGAGRQAPHVLAAMARPSSPEDQLYHAPCFNVFADARVCVGSHAFPADPARVPEDFFASFFSPAAGGGKSVKHPDDVGKLWEELDGHDTFPLEDLVPALPVADALRIGE